MIVKQGKLDFPQTIAVLIRAIESRGLTVFAHIDHADAARQVGMELPDEQVVLFGNPRAGTPLMSDDPKVGIELPLRMLVWKEKGRVLVGYRDPLELTAVYDVAQHRTTLEQMGVLLGALADEATAGV